MRNTLRALWLSPKHAYSDEIVRRIAESLPRFKNETCRQVFPMIVREWARWQIDAERNVVDPKSEVPLARKNLTKIENLSGQLLKALNNIDDAAIWSLASVASGKPQHEDDRSDIFRTNGNRAFRRAQVNFELLHEWSRQAIGILPTTVGRYRNMARKTVLTQLAELFEYLSGQVAARRIRGKDHPNHGRDYGPFWDFAVAMWLPIYGSKRGLSDLMKQWAFHRGRGQTSSRVIEAMRENHPEWGN